MPAGEPGPGVGLLDAVVADSAAAEGEEEAEVQGAAGVERGLVQLEEVVVAGSEAEEEDEAVVLVEVLVDELRPFCPRSRACTVLFRKHARTFFLGRKSVGRCHAKEIVTRGHQTPLCL